MSAPAVILRDVRDEDVPLFYKHQFDPVAVRMAAFPSRDWPSFAAHWDRVRQNSSNVSRTILVDGEVAGNLGSFVQEGQRFVGYWLGQAYWGRGVATDALRLFLLEVTPRPLFAHVVEHNRGSRRVLEKNGFQLMDDQHVFTEAPPSEVVELLFKLD